MTSRWPAPPHTLKKAWDKIRKDIQLGAEGDVSKYLDCNHVITNEIKHGKEVRVMNYEMTGL